MHCPTLRSALGICIFITNLLPSSTASSPLSDLDILAGQHVIYSYPSTSQPPKQLIDLTRAGLVGGVILFGENVDNNTAAAMASLREAYAASPAPKLLKKHSGKNTRFFITTDQEGGLVRRIKNGQPKLSAKQIGESSNPAAAGSDAGSGAAQSLREYGLNANLAPVLDVYRKAGDFEDFYQRSFGNTSQAVIAAALPFIKAQQAHGVPATAKHFPGLGSASHAENTDEQPVTLNLPLSQLRAIDEAPYAATISAGVLEIVMASWAIYPALDAANPAGLSSKWIKDELRGRLAFKGVTITDAIEAGAVKVFGDAREVAVLAAQAGMDLLLASARNVTQGEEVRKGLVGGLESGRLDKGEFKQSTMRIADMRSRLWA